MKDEIRSDSPEGMNTPDIPQSNAQRRFSFKSTHFTGKLALVEAHFLFF